MVLAVVSSFCPSWARNHPFVVQPDGLIELLGGWRSRIGMLLPSMDLQRLESLWVNTRVAAY
jgi:hypothetical protein